jgi:hypothetical protein
MATEKIPLTDLHSISTNWISGVDIRIHAGVEISLSTGKHPKLVAVEVKRMCTDVSSETHLDSNLPH